MSKYALPVSRPSVIIRFPDQDEFICGIIDNRVEGLETGSINTASRADSSMFLVLRPLIVFEMAACSNATAPFVEPITQLNKKMSIALLRVESSLEDTLVNVSLDSAAETCGRSCYTFW